MTALAQAGDVSDLWQRLGRSGLAAATILSRSSSSFSRQTRSSAVRVVVSCRATHGDRSNGAMWTPFSSSFLGAGWRTVAAHAFTPSGSTSLCAGGAAEPLPCYFGMGVAVPAGAPEGALCVRCGCVRCGCVLCAVCAATVCALRLCLPLSASCGGHLQPVRLCG